MACKDNNIIDHISKLEDGKPELWVRWYTCLVVVISFSISVVVGLLVISSSPAFIGGGDTSSYIAFAREIINNGFKIPATNSIHFPGSEWVYPPVVPYLFAVLSRFFGISGWQAFVFPAIVGVIANALIVVPVWKISNLLFGRLTATVTTLSFSIYLPNLYAITWGGYPQLFATLISAVILYFLIKIVTSNGNLKDDLILALLLGILYLTHDLSSFVVASALVLMIVAIILFRIVRPKAIPSVRPALHLSLSLGISAPFFLYWYLPRLWWIKDAAFGPASNVLQGNSSLASDLASVQPIWIHLSPHIAYIGAFSLLVVVSIMAAFLNRRIRGRILGLVAVSVFMFLPIFLMIWKVGDSVLFSRLSYYVFFPAQIFLVSLVSPGIKHLLLNRNKFGWNKESYKRMVGIVLSVIIVSLISVNYVHGTNSNILSHSYFTSFDKNTTITQQIDTLNWIDNNIPKNSIVASEGQLGFYLMGYAGLPTILYEPAKYLTQPVEWNESLAAYVLTNTPTQNVSKTASEILLYNISYVIIPGEEPLVPSFYDVVFSSASANVFQIGKIPAKYDMKTTLDNLRGEL